MMSKASVFDRLRGSYATKLAVALLAIVAVLVGYGVVVQAQATDQVRGDVRSELTTGAEMQAGELETWLASIKREARLTSRLPAVESGDTDTIQTRLDAYNQREQLPEAVAGVHYLDTDEMVITASSKAAMVGVSPAEQGAPFATDPPEFAGPDDVYVSKPFEVPAVEFPVVAVVTPVPNQAGAIVYMVNVRERTRSLTGTSGEGYITVTDGDGTFVAHPNGSRIGTTHHGGGDNPAVRRGVADETGFMRMDGGTVMAYAPVDGADWVAMIHTDESAAFALAGFVRSSLAGLIFMGIISLALVGATVGSSTVIALDKLSSKAKQMADGDLDVSLQTNRTDEIGTLYTTFDEMRGSLREQIEDAEAAREQAEQARAEAEAINDDLERSAEHYEAVMRDCADGDLTRRVDIDTDHEAMAAIGREFNDMLDEIEQTVALLKEFATDVTTAADDVDTNAADVREASETVTASIEEISAGAAEQTESLDSVASEMATLSNVSREIATAVDSIADTSREAADAGASGQEAAEAAVEQMDTVEAATEEAVERMRTLDKEMHEIGEVVEMIRDIAEQTNILALNASVEAARTDGDSDGFAVVADEVKSLAEETKDRADEIETRVERIQGETADTVEYMRETSETVSGGVTTVEEAIDELERIVEHVETIHADIQDINEATVEQTDAAQSASSLVDDVTAISEETTASAAEVVETASDQTAAIEAVSEQADALSERASGLDDLLDQFVVHSGETPSPGHTTAGDATVMED
jgi:methyl-accepting chemotaxis protein